MSVHVLSWVLRHSEAEYGDRLVLLALAEFAHDDGSDSYPSNETLQERTRMSERNVRYCLRNLESAGAIVPEGKGPKGTNRYRVVMEAQAQLSLGGQNLPGAKSGRKGGQSVAPEPSLKEPSVEANASTAQTLTKTFVDRSRAKGANPPSRVVGQIARETKILIEDGVTEPVILAAYDLMLERALHPSALASCVQQVGLNGHGPKRSALGAVDRARQWVKTVGWQYPDAALTEELSRFGLEPGQKRQLLDLAISMQQGGT